MLNAILLGLGYGLGLAFLPGPAFFKLIQTSLEKGFKPAAFIAAGIAISDFIYVVLVYSGVSSIIENETFKFGLGAGGGVILIAFGLTSVFKKRTHRPKTADLDIKRENVGMLFKGLAINFMNPGALFFWLATVSAAHINSNIGWEHFGFFAAILISLLSTDLLKAILARRISFLLTERLMRRLNIIIGVALILFGAKMLVETFVNTADPFGLVWSL